MSKPFAGFTLVQDCNELELLNSIASQVHRVGWYNPYLGDSSGKLVHYDRYCVSTQRFTVVLLHRYSAYRLWVNGAHWASRGDSQWQLNQSIPVQQLGQLRQGLKSIAPCAPSLTLLI